MRIHSHLAILIPVVRHAWGKLHISSIIDRHGSLAWTCSVQNKRAIDPLLSNTEKRCVIYLLIVLREWIFLYAYIHTNVTWWKSKHCTPKGIMHMMKYGDLERNKIRNQMSLYCFKVGFMHHSSFALYSCMFDTSGAVMDTTEGAYLYGDWTLMASAIESSSMNVGCW